MSTYLLENLKPDAYFYYIGKCNWILETQQILWTKLHHSKLYYQFNSFFNFISKSIYMAWSHACLANTLTPNTVLYSIQNRSILWLQPLLVPPPDNSSHQIHKIEHKLSIIENNKDKRKIDHQCNNNKKTTVGSQLISKLNK